MQLPIFDGNCHWYYGIMREHLTLDPTGRIVIPKSIRNELHLSPGDMLDIRVDGDEIVIRPKRSAMPLHKERGIWVLHTGKRLTAAETRQTLEQIRESRQKREAE